MSNKYITAEQADDEDEAARLTRIEKAAREVFRAMMVDDEFTLEFTFDDAQRSAWDELRESLGIEFGRCV